MQKIFVIIRIPSDADFLLILKLDDRAGESAAVFAARARGCLADIGDILPAIALAHSQQIVIDKALFLVIVDADVPRHHQRDSQQHKCPDNQAGCAFGTVQNAQDQHNRKAGAADPADRGRLSVRDDRPALVSAARLILLLLGHQRNASTHSRLTSAASSSGRLCCASHSCPNFAASAAYCAYSGDS